MRRFFDVANAITLTGLLAGLACAVLAVEGLLAFGAVALIVAGLCDLFDGFVARRLSRTEEQKMFGRHLDNVADAGAFGFAPAMLLYGAGLKSPVELAVLGLFVACAIWRLAYFGTVGLQENAYRGLPVTYAALVLPLALLVPDRWVLAPVAVLLAVAMVAPVRIPKPGGWWYAFFGLLAAALIAVHLGRALGWW